MDKIILAHTITEKQVLHFLLDHPEKILDMKGNYFVSQEGKTLQQVFQEFYERGVQFDNDTIVAEGVRRCQSIDHELLDRIRQQEYDDGSFTHYYQLLKELYAKERIQTDLLENFEKGIFSKGKINTKEMTNLLSQMQAYISLIENEEASDIKFVPELFNEYRNILAKRASGALRFTTGCATLDEAIPTGFAPGEITTIFGSTGVGKSTFKGYLRNCLVNRGVPVLDISLEMSLATEMDRWMASRTDIPLIEFTGTSKKTIDESIEHIVAKQEELLRARPKYGFMDVSKMSLVDLERTINKFKLTTKTDYAVVFVDLATMLTEFSGGDPKDYEKAINLTNEITKRTQVHMVLVVQAVQKTLENHRPTTLAGLKVFRPTLASIKNSGAIAERSRTVLSVYREKYYATRFFPDSVEAEESEDIVEVQVLKYSNGAVGQIVQYGYDPAQLKLTSVGVWRERKAGIDNHPSSTSQAEVRLPSSKIGAEQTCLENDETKVVSNDKDTLASNEAEQINPAPIEKIGMASTLSEKTEPTETKKTEMKPTIVEKEEAKSVSSEKTNPDPSLPNTSLSEQIKKEDDTSASVGNPVGNNSAVPADDFFWEEETESFQKFFVKFWNNPDMTPREKSTETVVVPFKPIFRQYRNRYGVYIQDIVWTPRHIELYRRTKEKFDHNGKRLFDDKGNKVLATLEEKTTLFSYAEFSAWIDDPRVRDMYDKMGADYTMKVYEIAHADEIAQMHPIPVKAPHKEEAAVDNSPVEVKTENIPIETKVDVQEVSQAPKVEEAQEPPTDQKMPLVEEAPKVPETSVSQAEIVSAEQSATSQVEQESQQEVKKVSKYTELIKPENIVPNPTREDQKKPFTWNKILRSTEDIVEMIEHSMAYYNKKLPRTWLHNFTYLPSFLYREPLLFPYLPLYYGTISDSRKNIKLDRQKTELYPVMDVLKCDSNVKFGEYRLLVKDKGWITDRPDYPEVQQWYEAWIKQHRVELPKVEVPPIKKLIPPTIGDYERYFLRYGERQSTGSQKLYFFTELGKEFYLDFELYVNQHKPVVPTDTKEFEEFAVKFYKEFTDYKAIFHNPEAYEALKDDPTINLDDPKFTIPDGTVFKWEEERRAQLKAEQEKRDKEKAAKKAAEKKQWLQELLEKAEAEKAKPRHPDSLLTMEEYVAKYGAVNWKDPNLPMARLDEDYYFKPYDMLDKTQDKYYLWQFWFLDQNSIFYNEDYRLHFDYPLFHKLFPHMAPYDYINIGGRYHVPRELKEVPGYTYGCFMGKLYQDLDEEQKKKARFYSKEYVRLVDLPSGKTICINDPFYFLPDERQREAIKQYMSHYADNVPKELIAEKEAFDKENNIIDQDWLNGGKPEMIFCPLRIDKDDAFDKVRAEEKKRIIEEHALRGETITEADIPRVGSMVVELQDNSGQFVDLGDPFYYLTGSEKKFYQVLHKRGQLRYMHEDLVKARKEFDKKHNIVNNTVYKDEPQYYD